MDAFDNFRLRDSRTTNAIIASSPVSCVFKPISETISFLEILERHPGAKGLFVFRNPLDVVISSLGEFGSALQELTQAISYNFVQNRLRNLGVELDDWKPVDAIIERFRGRFSLSSDLASKLALNWLLLHTTLLTRGVAKHPDIAMLAYEDLLEFPSEVSARLSMHLRTDVRLGSGISPERRFNLFSDKIDVQLARECMDLFQLYRHLAFPDVPADLASKPAVRQTLVGGASI